MLRLVHFMIKLLCDSGQTQHCMLLEVEKTRWKAGVVRERLQTASG